MYEVLDKIYVASTLEIATDSAPEIIQISQQPLYERSSVFIAENIQPPPFTSSLFNYCMTKNAPEMYQCDSCGFKVYLKVNLKVHMEMVHRLNIPISVENFCAVSDEAYNLSNILKCYVCEKCEFATHSLLVLLKHQTMKHKWKKKAERKPVISPKKYRQRRQSYNKSDNGKRFNCGQCGYVTKYKYHLKQHLQIKHPLPEDGQLYECDKCSFKTLEKHKFDSHNLKHAQMEEELFKCSLCCYTTKRKHGLSAHIKFRHTAEEDLRKYCCSYCPYWAKQKFNLNEHILAKHTSEENINWFLCEMCSFRGKTRGNLRKHMITHSENRFLLCEMCSTQFKRMSSLKHHMLWKHKIKM